MFVPFNELPDTSRIWIYQCGRELKEDEVTEIKKLSENFSMNGQHISKRCTQVSRYITIFFWCLL